MKNAYSALIVALLFVVGGAALAAQNPQQQDRNRSDNPNIPTKNPLEGNPDAIKYGMGLFRSRCADCHGVDARGVRSPDLTQVWASGRTDDGLFRTVKNGVPNTEMPANPRMFDHELWQILAYLKTLAAPAPNDPPRGNAENGQRLFRVHCASCHRVNNVGGRLGPDLSRIGAGRARDALVRRVRGAVEDFRPGYEPVTITPTSGQPVQGVKKNEDMFSVQIMDTRERIQGYEKDKMKEVKNETRSAMPSFGTDRLSESDLDDIVRYLGTLRGFDPAVK
jgi:putative heme-binding domain-containing protein